MKIKPSWAGIVLLVVMLADGRSYAIDRLNWKDLAPAPTLVENPFAYLPAIAQSAARDLFWIRLAAQRGRDPSEVEAMVRDAQTSIEGAGADFAEVAANVDAVLKQWNADRKALVTSLDGRIVQMPGYVLPLDYSGTAVTDFLLVPYVGACIHAPPPPPNQIVHVRSEEGYEISGLFAPVWVTGQMSARASKLSLSYVDGTADIHVGYELAADSIVPYE